LQVAENQKALVRLVAGAGFEPATFRLWAWRTYGAEIKYYKLF